MRPPVKLGRARLDAIRDMRASGIGPKDIARATGTTPAIVATRTVDIVKQMARLAR